MMGWFIRRLARAIVAEQQPLAVVRPELPADVLADLRAEVAALRAKIEAAPVLPETPTMAPVWNVIDDVAPEPGPFRSRMERVAARLLREPGANPEHVAGLLAMGDTDE